MDGVISLLVVRFTLILLTDAASATLALDVMACSYGNVEIPHTLGGWHAGYYIPFQKVSRIAGNPLDVVVPGRNLSCGLCSTFCLPSYHWYPPLLVC